EPSLAEAHWNLAQALLARGDLASGWREYEYRFLRRNASEPAFPYALWDGSRLDRGMLLLCAEQGVGDEIMFASCIEDALAEAHCTVECARRLTPLFARSFPGAHVIGRLEHPGDLPSDLPRPDRRIAVGSLPMIFRPDLESFPARRSYLVPDPEQV